MILLTVNGKKRELESTMSLVAYLDSLGISTKSIAVAHNGTIVRRDELPDVELAEGDQLEIVRAVGGG